MIAAIAGDIIGSVHERLHIKRVNFKLFQANSQFTDDTVMTLAVADARLHRRPYQETLHGYGRRFPRRGYGGFFRRWLLSDDPKPYGSFGNGSAMRVSPVGFAASTLREALDEARCSALPTHDHPEGIKGAQAIAAAVFLAKQGQDKAKIKKYIQQTFDYNLNRSIDRIRKHYRFDVTCQGSVPEAILAFLESRDVEHAIRLAISLGGDADTLACMAGGIAQAYYKAIPAPIYDKVRELLPDDLWTLIEAFNERFRVQFDVLRP